MLYNRWLSLSTHISIDISNSYQVCAFHSDCIPLWSTSPSELWQQHTLSSSSSPSSSVGNLLLNASNGSQYLSTLSNGVERSSLYTKATFRCLFYARSREGGVKCTVDASNWIYSSQIAWAPLQVPTYEMALRKTLFCRLADENRKWTYSRASSFGMWIET